MLKVTMLTSVDCCIDENGYVYPLNCDGTPDTMITEHVKDMSIAWYNDLSQEDIDILKNVFHRLGIDYD